MYRFLMVVSALLSYAPGYAEEPRTTEPDTAASLSVSKTQTIDFIGKTFILKYKETDQAVPIYEYFPDGDNPPAWNELVDFRVYPVHPDGNKPLDHARRAAELFKQQYPHMRFALYDSKESESVILDFFYPTSSRKDGEFLEFNSFLYYRDPGSNIVMSFHYAKNIPGMTSVRSMETVIDDLRKARAELVSAMAAFPTYTQ